MVSRFLFQKFSDGMSRSTSLLGTHATKYLKQIFSSTASKQAEMAAKQAQDGARKPEIPLRGIAQRDVDTTLALITLSGVGWFFILSNDDSGGTNKGSRCNCQCHCSNVKQD